MSGTARCSVATAVVVLGSAAWMYYLWKSYEEVGLPRSLTVFFVLSLIALVGIGFLVGRYVAALLAFVPALAAVATAIVDYSATECRIGSACEFFVYLVISIIFVGVPMFAGLIAVGVAARRWRERRRAD